MKKATEENRDKKIERRNAKLEIKTARIEQEVEKKADEEKVIDLKEELRTEREIRENKVKDKRGNHGN